MAPSIAPLESDDLHFYDIQYLPDGYHPIIVGDILGPSSERQYRIMHKLGWGGYSTVWLAQKTDSSKAFVAVKVTTADDGIDPTREASMLAKAQTKDGAHVLTLLDSFTLRGPNGTHAVLVTDIVVPMALLLFHDRTLRPLWRNNAAHGLGRALVSLHATGIVHGGNFGFSFPQIADQDPHSLMQDLDQHDMIIVLPISAAHQTPSLPAYVLLPCNLAKYYGEIAGNDLPQMKILDFGSAHEAGTQPPHSRCALVTHAPEMVFARTVHKIDNPPVEPPADVWALGAAIYQIFAYIDEHFKRSSISYLPRAMVTMAGSLPPGWEDWYANLTDRPEISSSAADAWWAGRWGNLRPTCADDKSTDALVTFLRKVLVIDPALRPTAAEVLQDPWFLHAEALSEHNSIAQ